MAWNFNFSVGRTGVTSVERLRDGSFWYQLFGSGYNRTNRITEKVKFVSGSPAVFKPITFNCDTAGMANINLYGVDGKKITENYLYQYQNQPNPNQSWSEFIKEYVFYKQIYECALLYENKGTMYFLNNSECNFSSRNLNEFKKLDFTSGSVKEKFKGTFTYRGQKLDMQNLVIIGDYRGASGDWLESFSKIDALYHIINGTNETVFANNEWLDKAQTFLATGDQEARGYNTVSTAPGMSTQEKTAIENGLSKKGITTTTSKVTVNPLVNNIGAQRFDEGFSAKYLFISAMFGIGKDLAEYLRGGATFENQEKSFGRHIDYTIKPFFQPLFDKLEPLIGIDQKQELRAEFDHLPFNAVFEKDRADKRKVDIDSLKISKDLGLSDAFVKQKLNELWGLS